MRHFLGIDVESWALNPAFRGLTTQDRKRIDAGTLPRQVDQFLRLFQRAHQRATWFVSAELFEWYPEAIHALAREGHEIAYHTHTHPEPITAEILRSELQQSRRFLDAFRPVGFRAPRLLMPPEAYPILARAGFQYSSSVYGDAGRPFLREGILELPVSSAAYRDGYQPPQAAGLTLSSVCQAFPYGSGLSLGWLGGRGTAWWIRRQARRGTASNLFLHVWQQQPLPLMMRRQQWRMAARNPLFFPYMRDTTGDLAYLLQHFDFHPCREILQEPHVTDESLQTVLGS